MLDKWKALCYIYIILINGYAKDGLLALKATTEIKRVLGRFSCKGEEAT